jgi:ATP-binding cassette, subfamily B, bacterial
MTGLRTLLALVAPFRRQLLLAGVLTVVGSLVTLAIPWLAGQLLATVVARDASDLGVPAALVVLALTVMALLNFAVAHVNGSTAARLFARLRTHVYDHLQGLPIGFHENHRQGDTMALMTLEIARLSQFISGTLTQVPSRLLTVLGAMALMARIDMRLAMLVPLLVPAFYLALKFVGRQLRGIAAKLQQAEAEAVAIAEENLEMLPAIKAFTREAFESDRYGRQIERATKLALRESRIYAALEPVIALVAAGGAVLLLVLAGQRLQSGQMTMEGLFGFLLYAALLTRPVGALAHVYGQVQSARGTLARLQSVLTEQTEPGYGASGRMEAATGDIEFNEVTFAYPGREQTLRGFDFAVRAGEVVALTGQNGAGKSTLVKLLLRFHDPDQGEILLDGRNIASLDVRDLRRQIGLVSQHVYLFNGTIRENIAYGLEGASEANVEAAARLAQAYDFISELPQAFETEIGDHGLRLSGGQRQRIALARALIKQPPILILDEATSMYDLDGESAFVAACETALAGRTVILITHRQASLAMADRVVHLADGKVQSVEASVERNGLAAVRAR